MDVAIKIMMFQQRGKLGVGGGGSKEDETCQQVLREAALCCSMAHPNVVATYHFEVLKASGYHLAPSGMRIQDQSNQGDFKLYLLQVCGHIGRLQALPPTRMWTYSVYFKLYLLQVCGLIERLQTLPPTGMWMYRATSSSTSYRYVDV